MKKTLTLTLILTLAFPAYCFTSPRGVLIDEKSDELQIMVEDIMNYIDKITEDGYEGQNGLVEQLEELQLTNDLSQTLIRSGLWWLILLIICYYTDVWALCGG